MRRLLLAALLAGCGSRTEVDYRFEFGKDFSDAQIASITSLHLLIHEAKDFDQTPIFPAGTITGREGRLVYIPSAAATTIQGSFDFNDDNGNVIGQAMHDQTKLNLGSPLELRLDVVAITPGNTDDLGISDGAPAADLPIPDLAMDDLSVPLDLSPPIDLAGRDFTLAAPTCPAGSLFCEGFEEFTTEPQLKQSGRWDDNADVTAPQSYVQIDTAGGAAGSSHSLKVGYNSPTSNGYLAPYALPLQQFQLPLFLRFYARALGATTSVQAQVFTFSSITFPGYNIEILQDSAPPQGLFVSTANSVSYFPAATSTATLSTTFDCWELDVYPTMAELYKNKSLVSWVSYGNADGSTTDMGPYAFPDGQIYFEFEKTVANGDPGYALEVDEILVGSQKGLCP
jgi:hypothetical protein